MTGESGKVDEYIARAEPFARPILERIREAFHEGCPDLEERIKWGAPSFVKSGIIGGMASFKDHASFGFWRGEEMSDPHGFLKHKNTASFMAEKVTAVEQLPPHEILVDYVRRAARLNRSGKPARTKPDSPSPAQEPPADLVAALADNPKAGQVFRDFPPGYRRDYIEWITDAKRPETRTRRLATTIELLIEGKHRNWKYAQKK